MRNKNSGIGGFIFAAFGLAVIVAIIGFVAENTKKPDFSKQLQAQYAEQKRETPRVDHYNLAYIASQDGIKKVLAAPSTAKFPPRHEVLVTSLGDDKYRVYGYVDAQNHFGAMLRNNYSATVEIRGGGSYYKITDINLY